MKANPDPSTFHLYWQSALDKTYQVQSTENLTNSWNVVDTIIGNGTVMTGYTDAIEVPQRFFRLETDD